MDGVHRTTRQTPTGLDDALIVVLIVALLGLGYALNAPLMLMDGDTGWHLATGRWIVAHGQVPTTDPFSFTARGRFWVAHEWLSDVAMFVAWRAGGWSGLIALTAAAFAALLVITGLHLRRWLGGPAILAALALLGMALGNTLIARPHVLALPLLAGWVVLLLRARAQDRAPSPGWAALMLVWANAHGSFLLGLVLAGAFALEALIDAPTRRRWLVVRRWAGFGLTSTGAALLTPSGIHGLFYPLYVSRLALLPYIQEWRPVDFAQPGPFELLLLTGLFVLLVRPTRVPPIRLLLLLGVLHLALQHMRQVTVFAILATLILAEPIGRAWTGATAARSRPVGRGDRAAIGVAIVIALGLAAARLAVPVERTDSEGVPTSAIAALPPALRTRAVFNEYSFGGALILAGIRPYIDGRSDMYGDDFSIDYFRIAAGDRRRWRAAERRWRFGWTILPPGNRIVTMLDADPRWRRAYADATAVVHVRRRSP
ncbi:hypothetical protein [Sphingomonas rubra]|uniref:4-amino-4-deoxy-L-arabinose transferase n=1 Tax=Sphingomonas rubra TaxID=634430 RepID=A0A1I5T3Z6_9SPHN|nr:hypothetical protein [Sphingomonas rubra]SFP77725.1 hypothetical protein SAMN04488241_10729 [Sphingomonas rubra]